MDINSLIINLRIKEDERRNADLNNRCQLLWNNEAASQIDQQFSSAAAAAKRKLKITYVMNHARVCGGSKIILEHTNHLVKRGHEVTIVCHFPKPDWMEVAANYIQVPFQVNIAQAIPESDIIVTTVYDQNIDCYLSKIAPIIHFEQGDIYIYDFDKYSPEQQLSWKKHYSLPIPILAVSSGLADTIEKNFQRKPQILHNALDSNVFYPCSQSQQTENDVPRILLVGSEQTAFKGIDVIRKALNIVAEHGCKFETVWVTPTPPDSTFEGQLVVNPSQSELGDIYRSCDIYVSGSFYESFPLPPLEAMSCGCAVVSTNNVGIREYAESGKNSILTEVGSHESMAKALIKLIENHDLRKRLIEAGYQTAERFKWERIITELEHYFFKAIEISPVNNQLGSLRVEYLPQGISKEEAFMRIEKVHAVMEEEWCLWLVDGESISEPSLSRIRSALAAPIEEIVFIQVLYTSDIPDHPIIRWENRLLKKSHTGICLDAASGGKLHLKISGGSEGYFISEWLNNVRELYRNRRNDDLILFLKNVFGSANEYEKPVVLKWLILGLMEKDMLSTAVSMLNDSLELYPAFTDNMYLYARLAIEMGESSLSKTLLERAILIGDAADSAEWFGKINEHCTLYL